MDPNELWLEAGTPQVVSTEAAMVFLNGSKQSFRCHCGCNVFAALPGQRYRCNTCDELYQGS